MTETKEEREFRLSFIGDGYLKEEAEGVFHVIAWTEKGDEVFPLADLTAFRDGVIQCGERVAFEPVVDAEGWTCATDVRKLASNRYRGIVHAHPSGRLIVRRTGPSDAVAWIDPEDTTHVAGDMVFCTIRPQAFHDAAVDLRADS